MKPKPRRRRRLAFRGGRPTTDDAALAWGASRALEDGDEGLVPVARGVRLWYRVVGDGSEVVIVPCAGNAADFTPLCVAGCTVVFYDVRSRGRSDLVRDPTRLGFSVEVTDLEAIRQQFGIDVFSALGWSYHAGVIATYALQHPERVRRMVLAAAIPPLSGVQPDEAHEPTPADVARLDQLEASGLRERDPEAMCRAWRQVYVPLQMGEPAAFDRLADPCACANEWPWQVAQSLVYVFAQLGSYDWLPHLRELSVPTLVVHGTHDRDPIEVARAWVDGVRDGRLLEVVGAGSYPWIERPEIFFAAVNDFLAGRPI